MKALNKVIILFFLFYVSVMSFGLLQDYMFYKEVKNDVILTNRTRDNDVRTNEQILHSLEEMSREENLCLYVNDIKSEDQVFFFVDKKSCETLEIVLDEHTKNDIDNLNKMSIDEGAFPVDKIKVIRILNGNFLFKTEMLTKYNLDNYAQVDVEFSNNNLVLLLQKYVTLSLILLLVTAIIIYLDFFNQRKKMYIFKISGEKFGKSYIYTYKKKLWFEFGGAIIILALFTYAFFNINFIKHIYIYVYILAIYGIGHLVGFFAIRQKYQKIAYQSTFKPTKRFLTLIKVLYMLILSVLLINITQITILMNESKETISTIKRYEDVHMISNVVLMSFDERVGFTNKVSDLTKAYYITEGSIIENKKLEYSDRVFNVNKNYIIGNNIVVADESVLNPEDEKVIHILIPRELEEEYEEELSNQTETERYFVYDSQQSTFETFTLRRGAIEMPIFVLEKNIGTMENGFVFIGDREDIQKDLDKFYVEEEITIRPEIISFYTLNKPLLDSYENELLDLTILVASYIFVSLYFIVLVVFQVFEIEKKRIILLMFFGNPLIVSCRSIFASLMIPHILGTVLISLIRLELFKYYLIFSLILFLFQMIVITIVLQILLHKNIPLFLKGEE